MNDIKRGFIKLPRFQRGYVWEVASILKLLDSIYKGYPIGSILLWRTREVLASIRTIGDIAIAESDDDYPTKYVLDGQQRLSTICGVLHYNEKSKNDIWNIVFDKLKSKNEEIVAIDSTSIRVHQESMMYIKKLKNRAKNRKI